MLLSVDNEPTECNFYFRANEKNNTFFKRKYWDFVQFSHLILGNWLFYAHTWQLYNRTAPSWNLVILLKRTETHFLLPTWNCCWQFLIFQMVISMDHLNQHFLKCTFLNSTKIYKTGTSLGNSRKFTFLIHTTVTYKPWSLTTNNVILWVGCLWYAPSHLIAALPWIKIGLASRTRKNFLTSLITGICT